MDGLMEIALSAAYALFFIFLISRMKFFRNTGIPLRWFQGIFVVKILFGLALSLIYTYYYTDRSTADIYKYFDDSKVLFEALWHQPKDYFQMLLGICNDSPYFDRYYDQMMNWYREYDSNLYNDSHTIIRFNALVRLFSLGYYNVHTVFMCFLSLIGLTALYKTFEREVKGKNYWFFAAVFLAPSVIFWGSGVLKEGLLFFGLGLLVFYFHKLIKGGRKWKYLLWVLVGSCTLVLTKFYVFAAILPGLVANFWLEQTGNKHVITKYVVSYTAIFLLALNIHHVYPNYNPLRILTIKQKDFINLAEGGTYLQRITKEHTDTIYIEAKYHPQLSINDSTKKAKLGEVNEYTIWSRNELRETREVPQNDPAEYRLLLDYGQTGSKIEIPRLQPNIWDFLSHTPRALFNSFFQPLPWQISSAFMLLAAMENLGILFLLLLAIIYFDRQVFGKRMFWFCLSYTIVIYALTGLVTPVIGAIVRYKIAALPFLLVLIIMMMKTDNFERSMGIGGKHRSEK